MFTPSPQFASDLRRREGSSLSVYLDSKGIPTQGIGHTSGVRTGGPDITPEKEEQWLQEDLQWAYEGALRLFPSLDALDSVRREALIDLCFNMGEATLSEFTPFIKAVNEQDWEEAPWHILTNSKGHLTPYLLQVGARAVDNALRLCTGAVLPEFKL